METNRVRERGGDKQREREVETKREMDTNR
jgi:hypothetical protein